MQGRIIKGVGGFYYVDSGKGEAYECRAKGIFRKEKLKPLVGDYVEIEVLDEKEKAQLLHSAETLKQVAATLDL